MQRIWFPSLEVNARMYKTEGPLHPQNEALSKQTRGFLESPQLKGYKLLVKTSITCHRQDCPEGQEAALSASFHKGEFPGT